MVPRAVASLGRLWVVGVGAVVGVWISVADLDGFAVLLGFLAIFAGAGYAAERLVAAR